MKGYEITYERTGSGETKKYDTVMIWENDTFDFEDETFETHSLTDCLKAFEKIAAKWWGTYETQHAITNIEIVTM